MLGKTTCSVNLKLTSNTVGSYPILTSRTASQETHYGPPTATITLTVSADVPNTSTYNYYLPYLTNNSNGYTLYLVFQNVGNTKANFTLSYFNNNGTALSTPNLQGTCASLVAYAECIPVNAFLAGQAGTGVIVSDPPLNIIVAEGTPFYHRVLTAGRKSPHQLVVS